MAQFSEHIKSHFSFLKNKKLLVAISGGIDSVVLTDLLYQLNFSIALAHCNFGLRGTASDQDAIFVKKLADKLKVGLFTKTFDTNKFAKQEKLSIQVAARELRYDWFDQLMKEHKFDVLITAHHADDNLETFLINFIRGTGLDGLTGIPGKKESIIRPLLLFTRTQIEKYAQENKLTWREDASNAEIKYLRNRIRHQVIPGLKELNPGLSDTFNKTIQNLKGSQQIVEDRLKEVSKTILVSTEVEGLIKYNIREIKKLSDSKAYLYQLLKPYGFTEWNDVNDLLNTQSGKQVHSKTHRLVKDRDFLLLSELSAESTDVQEYEIKAGETRFKTAGVTLELVYLKTLKIAHDSANIVSVDANELKFPLIVRKWKSGDYFYPLGMQGKKKLSKFFKDEKMSLPEKENIWLLCSGSQIVWLIGRRLDNRFKITDKTKNILKIEST